MTNTIVVNDARRMDRETYLVTLLEPDGVGVAATLWDPKLALDVAYRHGPTEELSPYRGDPHYDVILEGGRDQTIDAVVRHLLGDGEMVMLGDVVRPIRVEAWTREPGSGWRHVVLPRVHLVDGLSDVLASGASCKLLDGLRWEAVATRTAGPITVTTGGKLPPDALLYSMLPEPEQDHLRIAR